jgi:galactoside O-acetyltransferase
MEKTHKALSGKGSSLTKYKNVVVGSSAIGDLLYYELCLWLGVVPGALGMVLRKAFWPRMFASCGRGVMFGSGIVVRHPGRIHLGDNVVISEHCILDGRGDAEQTIHLGNDVILSNQVMLSCKNGSITIGDCVGINAQSIIQSTNKCPVIIDKDCVLGQRCFIVGGGSYNTDRLDIPIREQGIKADGGVRLDAGVWLGGNVTVLGGVRMGRGSVAGAGAVLTRSVGEYTVSVGVPARVVTTRKA